MNTFSLLQLSLDQTIDRHALEDASEVITSVSRADCARLHRDLFGIVVSNLSETEALAFQAELKQRDFPTAVVADGELSALPESLRIQTIERHGEVLILTDSMGNERVRSRSELDFLAAGFVSQLHFKSAWHQQLDSGDSSGSARLVTERQLHEETEREFRLDFFFNTAPQRLHARLCMGTQIFHQGKLLLVRDQVGTLELAVAMADLLPADRLNTFLREITAGRTYPSMHGYEEEIRWHFHRLRRSA